MSKASVYYNIADLSGKHDVKTIKKQLDGLAGVLSVSVNEAKNSIAVDYDDTGVSAERIGKHVKALGYTVEESKKETHIM